MRIAICSPWSRRSAVGRSSRALAEALEQRAEVTVFYPEVDDPLASGLRTVPGLDPHRHANALWGHDHVLYAIGDHSWHDVVRRTSNLVPGVVILHDLSVANLAWAHAVRDGGPEAWLAMVVAWHGPDARRRAASVLAMTAPWQLGPVAPAELHFRDWVTRGATGVLVHSACAARLVASERSAATPTATVPLAYPLPKPSLERPRVPGLVVVAGSLHPDRHGECIIGAVAGVARHRDVQLVFVGGAEPSRVDALTQEARAHGIEHLMQFTGPVSDGEFLQWLHDASVVINLRRPVLQTGSATLLEQLAVGATVIVLDEGLFAELPDGVALRLREPEVEPLTSLLLRTLEDPELRRRIGAEAAAWVAETHAPPRVAAAVVHHLGEVEQHRPFLELSHRLAWALRPVVATPADPLAHRVGAAADELFGRALDGPPVPLPRTSQGAC